MTSDHLEERVHALERECRRSRLIHRVGGVVLLGLLASSLSRQGDSSTTLERLEIVDSEGNLRILAEAEPTPHLEFRSRTGEEQIRLALGDDKRWGTEERPNLSLSAGPSSILLSVRPPRGEESVWLSGSAELQMNSLRTVDGKWMGKTLNTIVRTDKANIGIATLDPEQPEKIMGPPGVFLGVDSDGRVETKLGSEPK